MKTSKEATALTKATGAKPYGAEAAAHHVSEASKATSITEKITHHERAAAMHRAAAYDHRAAASWSKRSLETGDTMKVGDKVKINRPGHASYGKEGVIKKTSKSGTVHSVEDFGMFHKSQLKAAGVFDTPSQADSEEAAELVSYKTMKTLFDQSASTLESASSLVDELISGETEDPTESPEEEAAEEEVETAQIEAVRTLCMAAYGSLNAVMTMCEALLRPDAPDSPRYMANKMQDCPLCGGSGNVDGNPCDGCDGSGEVRAAAGARHSAGDREIIQGMHDHAVSLGAECSPKAMEEKVEEKIEEKVDAAPAALKAACGCETKGESKMTKEQKTEVIKTLVANRHSGFAAGDEPILEAASDERLEAFLVAAQAREKEVVKSQEGPKALTEEEFMKVAPESLKTLISRQQRQETELKAELVTVLKAAQSEYTESELSAMSTENLERLARMANIREERPTYEGRGVSRAAADKTQDVFANPPDPYAAGLEKMRAARQ